MRNVLFVSLLLALPLFASSQSLGLGAFLKPAITTVSGDVPDGSWTPSFGAGITCEIFTGRRSSLLISPQYFRKGFEYKAINSEGMHVSYKDILHYAELELMYSYKVYLFRNLRLVPQIGLYAGSKLGSNTDSNSLGINLDDVYNNFDLGFTAELLFNPNWFRYKIYIGPGFRMSLNNILLSDINAARNLAAYLKFSYRFRLFVNHDRINTGRYF